jgi:crotonobetainyl-CoA:carnitine CoA-transferase CaiB-like acyl-CoA transferase
MGTGFLSALAVVAALRHRDLTGEGQRVQTSLLSTAITLSNNLLNWFAATDPPVWEKFETELAEMRARGAGFDEQKDLWSMSVNTGSFGNIYFRHYRTNDGFVSVGCLSPALHARFRAVTGVDDPRLRGSLELGTPEAHDAIEAMVREAEDLFRSRTTAEWVATLRAGGVPCGPYNFPTEVFHDPQVLANEFIVEIDHPAVGPYKTFAPPIRMDRTPTRIQGPSPLLDADTDDVLREMGIDDAESARLRAAGIVGRVPGE